MKCVAHTLLRGTPRRYGVFLLFWLLRNWKFRVSHVTLFEPEEGDVYVTCRVDSLPVIIVMYSVFIETVTHDPSSEEGAVCLEQIFSS